MLRQIASARSQLACETLKLLIVQLQNDWTSMAGLAARESLFSLKQTWQHDLALETTTILYKCQQKHFTVKHNGGGLAICVCFCSHCSWAPCSHTVRFYKLLNYGMYISRILHRGLRKLSFSHDFRLDRGKESQKDFNRKITINSLLAYKNLWIWHLPSLHPHTHEVK